ncbi:12648_t:CDS:2 [Gigaspora rosea]|nr:12648_t:CDS:2 [Gigaspora rosea]
MLKTVKIDNETIQISIYHAYVIGWHENNPAQTKQAPRNFTKNTKIIVIAIDIKHPKINGGVARSWD